MRRHKLSQIRPFGMSSETMYGSRQQITDLVRFELQTRKLTDGIQSANQKSGTNAYSENSSAKLYDQAINSSEFINVHPNRAPSMMNREMTPIPSLLHKNKPKGYKSRALTGFLLLTMIFTAGGKNLFSPSCMVASFFIKIRRCHMNHCFMCIQKWASRMRVFTLMCQTKVTAVNGPCS